MTDASSRPTAPAPHCGAQTDGFTEEFERLKSYVEFLDHAMATHLVPAPVACRRPTGRPVAADPERLPDIGRNDAAQPS
ncbi:hypothetical protein [Flavisphingomonas formosensis]|uniref:hypothetical protein n=1 Tax=Flavisphingomonas formosensis TaxID=861534 RepID=UPI0012F9617E|nr:hypothetical protein [Sphingomonas formosensis]